MYSMTHLPELILLCLGGSLVAAIIQLRNSQLTVSRNVHLMNN